MLNALPPLAPKWWLEHSPGRWEKGFWSPQGQEKTESRPAISWISVELPHTYIWYVLEERECYFLYRARINPRMTTELSPPGDVVGRISYMWILIRFKLMYGTVRTGVFPDMPKSRTISFKLIGLWIVGSSRLRWQLSWSVVGWTFGHRCLNSAFGLCKSSP